MNDRPHTEDDSVIVAVLDGGIDASHPALVGSVEDRWTLPGLEGAISDHGTSVAGLVAGHHDRSFGGGAPESRLLDVVVADEHGFADPEGIAAGLRWAVGAGADVVLVPLLIEHDVPALRQAVAEAVEQDVVVVAANGNGIGSFVAYPAAYDGVIAVTSHDADGARAPLANGYGAWFSMLGQGVTAPIVGDGYATVSGTSIASATAAGLIADCWYPQVPSPDDSVFATFVMFPDGPVPVLECAENN